MRSICPKNQQIENERAQLFKTMRVFLDPPTIQLLNPGGFFVLLPSLCENIHAKDLDWCTRIARIDYLRFILG